MAEFVDAVKEFAHPSCPTNLRAVHRYYLLARYPQMPCHLIHDMGSDSVTWEHPSAAIGKTTTSWGEFEEYVLANCPVEP